MAQTDVHLAFARQAWQSWHGVARLGAVLARGDAAPFCVAGLAQPYIHLRFTWQVWHKLTSTLLSRGRRGAHGMGWRAWSGLVARDAAAVSRRMARRSTDRCVRLLPVLARLLSDMFNRFLLLACLMSNHICGQVVVFVVVATTGRSQVRLEQHCATQT